ncbi:XRE family transcriptional regulator [Streptomyces sp. NBC_00237]|uniref:helix-turn-helix domain-containing protein n=1 Tax=Streptomyces sp. NBC_00237 TaxID=2975687 RepID=UPI00224ED96C|nr:XRE family transcriptional regulator [Streptomyces sp. NBC_00237]MCX5204711.1 XRE family transcriptional regulator [Streptomyces sp. NBC_00237]
MRSEGQEPVPGGDRAHLAAELRELRIGTGLSLAALADRTPYSKSSWERYLNGKKPVPRQAVEALCTVAGVPPARLLALWELADACWSGRSEHASGTVPVREPVVELAREPGPVRRGWQPYALMVGGALVGAAAVALGVGLAALGAGGPPDVGSSPQPTRGVAVAAGCLGAQCVGRMPRGMGCGQSGAATSLVDRTARGGQRVEIRYSSVCRAVWVRASFLKAGDKVALYPALEDETDGRGETQGAENEGGETSQTGPKVMRAEAVDVGDATDWVVTPMLAPRDPAGVRACLEPAAGGAPECFAG